MRGGAKTGNRQRPRSWLRPGARPEAQPASADGLSSAFGYTALPTVASAAVSSFATLETLA